ncbi:MAG: carboxypeptidase-like regulatory domain-containing protein [Thermoproteota archaeon]
MNLTVVSGSFTVSGKTVDVNGNPLGSVKVDVYMSDSLVTKTYTPVSGVFSINLDPGMYEIKFEKKGYETRSIMVSASFPG